MALPPFTTRQLFVRITWIGVGMGAIALSLREWDFPQDNPGAEIPVRAALRVIGMSIVCLGIIPLITTRPPLRVLGLVLIVGGPVGGSIGNLLSDATFISRRLSGVYLRPAESVLDLMPWIGMTVGCAIMLAIFAVLADPQRAAKNSARAA